MITTPRLPPPPQNRFNSWGGLPIQELADSPARIIARIPRFEKIASEHLGLGANRHSDVVVAHVNDKHPPVPVGLVSKTYKLVQHGEVIERALRWIESLPGAILPERIELSATANFERILARFNLGENFRISPDGNPVTLQLLCRNSVDGSTAIRARLGWFRLVCSNGLIVGVTLGKTRLTHKPDADLNTAFAPLSEEIGVVAKDKERIAKWAGTSVSLDRIRSWVDGPLAKAWNPLAACKVWNIANTGRDAKFVPPFEKRPPSMRTVELLNPVPGSPERAETIYDVVQAMSWVASRRGDFDEVEQRQRQIGELAESLMN